MSELVERLRRWVDLSDRKFTPIDPRFVGEAANRIEELERELLASVETMEEQVRRMERLGRTHYELSCAIERARAVLEKKS